MSYYKFEKLDVWKLARQFTNVIYKVTKKLNTLINYLKKT